MEDFKWTDELVNEYNKFCIQNGSFLSMFEIDTKELFKVNIKNKGFLTPNDIISAYYKAHEQPKKNYEILTYQHIVLSNELDKNIIIDKTSKHFEYAHGCQNDFKIYSVRRLSDGEVFSVGDKMKEEDDVYVIDAFWKDYKGNDLWVSYNQRKKYGCSLDTAKKAKEVLFTTEDGKEVYNEDNVFLLCTKTWHKSPAISAPKDPFSDDGRIKYFSTEKAREEYILMNKPILSLNDLIIVWDGDRLVGLSEHYKSSPMFQRFKELAKLKL